MLTSVRLRCLLLVGILSALATASDSPPGEAELKALVKAAADQSGSLDSVRERLQGLRREYPGTPVALRAAGLLRDLPSPLDALSANSIPEMERFRWQSRDLVAIAGDHRGRHGQVVAAVAVSPDGKRIASAGTYHVRIWDSTTMRQQSHLMHHYCTSAQFSKDGTFLALGNNNGILILDTPTGKEMKLRHAIFTRSGGSRSVAIHPSGKYVAASCYDGSVRVFDVSSPKYEDHAQVNGHNMPVYAVAYSPDGKLLATASADGTIRIWDHAKHQERSRIKSGKTFPTALAFSPSGHTLASGYADGSVMLWPSPPSPRPKKPRAAFSTGKTSVVSLSYSGTGNTMAVTNGTAWASIWRVSGKPALKSRSSGHEGICTCAALSPSGRALVTGGTDHMVRAYDVSKVRPVERVVGPGHPGHAYSIAFSPSGSSFVSGSIDKQILIWDVAGKAFKPRPPLRSSAMPVLGVAWSPDGNLIAATADTKVRQWEAAKGKPRTSLPALPSQVVTLQYSPDGKFLLTHAGKEVRVSNSKNGGTEQRLDAGKQSVHGAAFSADGKRVATISGHYVLDDKGRILIKDGKAVHEDCLLRWFGIEKGEELTAAKGWDKPPRGLACSPDGKKIWAGDGLASVRRFNLDGDKLASAGPDWPTKTGYQGGLVPSPDGNYLLVATSSLGFQIWDIAMGKPVKDLSFSEFVGSVAWAPDSRHLAVGLGTGIIQVLRLSGPKKK